MAARKAKKAEPQELLDNLPCPEMGIASAVTKSTIRSLNTSQVGKAVNANSNQVQVEIHMSGSVKGGREVQTSSSIEDCLLHDVHSDGPGAASTAVNVAGSSLSVPGTVIPQEEEVVRIRYKENTTEETAKSPALISGRTNGVRLEPLKLEDLKSRKKKKPAVLFPWYKVQPDSSEGSVGSDEDGATVSRKGPAALPLGGDPPVECPPDPPLLPVIHNVMGKQPLSPLYLYKYIVPFGYAYQGITKDQEDKDSLMKGGIPRDICLIQWSRSVKRKLLYPHLNLSLGLRSSL